MEHRNTFRKGDGIRDTTIRRTTIQQAYQKQSGQGKNLKKLKIQDLDFGSQDRKNIVKVQYVNKKILWS